MILLEHNFLLINFVSAEPALSGLVLLVAYEVFSRAVSGRPGGTTDLGVGTSPGTPPPGDDPDRWKKVLRKVVTLAVVTASVGLVVWWVFSSGEVPPSSPAAAGEVARAAKPFVAADAFADIITRLEKPGSAAVALVNSLGEGTTNSPLTEVAAERLFDYLVDTSVPAAEVNDLLERSITAANKGVPKGGPVTLASFVETLRADLKEANPWLVWEANGKLVSFLEGLNPAELKVVLETYLAIPGEGKQNLNHWACLALQEHLEKFPHHAARLTQTTLGTLYKSIGEVAQSWSEGSQILNAQRGYLRRLVESGAPLDEANQLRLAFKSFRHPGEEIARRVWNACTLSYGPTLRWNWLGVIFLGGGWGRRSGRILSLLGGGIVLAASFVWWWTTAGVVELSSAAVTSVSPGVPSAAVTSVPSDHALLELARRSSRFSPARSLVSTTLWPDAFGRHPTGLNHPAGHFLPFVSPDLLVRSGPNPLVSTLSSSNFGGLPHLESLLRFRSEVGVLYRTEHFGRAVAPPLGHLTGEFLRMSLPRRFVLLEVCREMPHLYDWKVPELLREALDHRLGRNLPVSDDRVDQLTQLTWNRLTRQKDTRVQAAQLRFVLDAVRAYPSTSILSVARQTLADHADKIADIVVESRSRS